MDKSEIRRLEKETARHDRKMGRPRRRTGHLDEFTVGGSNDQKNIRHELESL